MSSGGAASGRKGSVYERELVNRFLDAGWGALRLGASGGGGDADLPDVLAGRPSYHHHGGAIEPMMFDWGDWLDDSLRDRVRTQALAIELKSGKATTLYVEADEVDALEAFARRWGARPFLGARFTTQGSGTHTYLVPPERARGPTDGGRYGLPVSSIEDRAEWVVDDEEVRRCD